MEQEVLYACLACGATQLIRWDDDKEVSWDKLREIGDWQISDFLYCPTCTNTKPRPPQKYKVEDDRLVPLHV